MGCQFRAAVSGQDAFFVAVHAHGSLNGREVRKIPNLLANKEFPLIKLGIQPGKIVHLKFLAEHLPVCIVNTGIGIRTVFREHDRLADFLPEIQLRIQRVTRRIQIAAEIIPAIIPVQAHDIHHAGDPILGIVILAAYQGDRAILRVAGMRQFIKRIEIVAGRLGEMLRIRLVGNGSHHHGGVVLIPRDHIPDHIFVMAFDLQCMIRVSIGTAANAYRRHFVNNYDALPVAQIIHFLSIWVMTCPERICSQPVD